MSGVNTHNLDDNVHQLFDIVDNVHDADIDSHYRDVLGILCPFFIVKLINILEGGYLYE